MRRLLGVEVQEDGYRLQVAQYDVGVSFQDTSTYCSCCTALAHADIVMYTSI